MKKWIYDDKKWQNVFTPKPYDFLLLVSEGRLPWYDNELKKWVDKEEFDNERKELQQTNEERIANSENELRVEEDDEDETFKNSVTISDEDNEDEDLPF